MRPGGSRSIPRLRRESGGCGSTRRVDPATQAAALRLDPIADREEYAALADLLADGNPITLQALADSNRPEARRLGLRIRNLGVDRYSVWAAGGGFGPRRGP